MGVIISCSYEKKLLVAMFTVMYFTCLRIGSGPGEHILQIDQISVNGTGNIASSFIIQFKSFKRSGGGTPSLTIQKRMEGPVVCPLAVLLEYLKGRPRTPGPLFILLERRSVTRDWFIAKLRLCLGSLGFVVSGYNTHSSRIGRATDLFDDNCPDMYVQEVGKWALNAFKRYIRQKVVMA